MKQLEFVLCRAAHCYQLSTSRGSIVDHAFSYSSALMYLNSVGRVIGRKFSPFCSNSSSLFFVSGRLALTLYIFTLWQLLVTCSPQFQLWRTFIGCVLRLLSQQRTTSSVHPSWSHGIEADQVLHAYLCFGDRFSIGTAYQAQPPSEETSTRSGQRPPPE